MLLESVDGVALSGPRFGTRRRETWDTVERPRRHTDRCMFPLRGATAASRQSESMLPTEVQGPLTVQRRCHQHADPSIGGCVGDEGLCQVGQLGKSETSPSGTVQRMAITSLRPKHQQRYWPGKRIHSPTTTDQHASTTVGSLPPNTQRSKLSSPRTSPQNSRSDPSAEPHAHPNIITTSQPRKPFSSPGLSNTQISSSRLLISRR